MSDETQKRLIAILATAIAYVLASRLAERFVDEPEVRGVRDDFNEALVHAAFSLASTVLASLVIRRMLGSRWEP
ncbi:MAG TPA: hypothetical protein VK869_00730 [Rubrobacteraceae bacterium]|nr:hypothetical protein [Rubrobacteraceae bacterium]